jgi:hypothetical protein
MNTTQEGKRNFHNRDTRVFLTCRKYDVKHNPYQVISIILCWRYNQDINILISPYIRYWLENGFFKAETCSLYYITLYT